MLQCGIISDHRATGTQNDKALGLFNLQNSKFKIQNFGELLQVTPAHSQLPLLPLHLRTNRGSAMLQRGIISDQHASRS
jgi:hypothetical protein